MSEHWSCHRVSWVALDPSCGDDDLESYFSSGSSASSFRSVLAYMCESLSVRERLTTGKGS